MHYSSRQLISSSMYCSSPSIIHSADFDGDEMYVWEPSKSSTAPVESKIKAGNDNKDSTTLSSTASSLPSTYEISSSPPTRHIDEYVNTERIAPHLLSHFIETDHPNLTVEEVGNKIKEVKGSKTSIFFNEGLIKPVLTPDDFMNIFKAFLHPTGSNDKIFSAYFDSIDHEDEEAVDVFTESIINKLTPHFTMSNYDKITLQDKIVNLIWGEAIIEDMEKVEEEEEEKEEEIKKERIEEEK